ncbi:MAG: hypothetical protein JOS17DRAFT_748926 [Linnemannia elongata]|nr:MAG: hypothetical protein JOS17DRAFT_748926 [Linnemannia elongata]
MSFGFATASSTLSFLLFAAFSLSLCFLSQFEKPTRRYCPIFYINICVYIPAGAYLLALLKIYFGHVRGLEIRSWARAFLVFLIPPVAFTLAQFATCSSSLSNSIIVLVCVASSLIVISLITIILRSKDSA